MVYKALYRQWRPKDFRELVGQEHVSKTFVNALKKGRIAHAYLFAGPRGTGKTSTARILAKAVNCQSPIDSQPCNQCDNCNNINNGRSLDVIEIDAASNRGIDEIRDIREKVNFAPNHGKYKVYIVDEVHMLTAEAFNALLKTLEDPPAHVIFILATTEIHKIPPTILSRCQRYDFRKIAPVDIEERLEEILKSNDISAEEGVLSLIVKKADGGLRDAISFLDQCLSYNQDDITLSVAYEVLGLVKSEILFSISDAMQKKDTAKLLVEINQILKDGIESSQIIRDMLEHFRNMVILLVCGLQSQLVLSGQEEKKRYYEQAEKFGIEWLTKAVSVLSKVEVESRWRPNMRIVLETTLISLLHDRKSIIDKEIARKETKQEIKQKEVEQKEIPQEEVLQDKAIENHKGNNDDVKLVVEKWPQIMKSIKEHKKTVYAFLTVCEPKNIVGDKIQLCFKSGYTFHKEKIEEPENIKIIQTVLKEELGVDYRLECYIEKKETEVKDPGLQKALDIFGSDIVNIKD